MSEVQQLARSRISIIVIAIRKAVTQKMLLPALRQKIKNSLERDKIWRLSASIGE
jgi:septum formation topological specificity factor MinE